MQYRGDRDLWIIEKYVKRSFVKPSELDQENLDKVSLNFTCLFFFS